MRPLLPPPTRLAGGERPALGCAPQGGGADLPAGFAVVLDRSVRRVGERALLGGRPARLLRLSPRAVGMLEGDRLVVTGSASAALARRLLDAGVAHPAPAPRPPAAGEVSVVVPVRDRPGELARLLGSLGNPASAACSVIVVDDGSADAAAVAVAASSAGAGLVRHASPRGPAAARNTGLRAASTPLVAFVDSDCVAPPGWLAALLGHFDDPMLAAVAPRIVGWSSPGTRLGRLEAYEHDRSSLDLGPHPAPVAQHGAVAWLPGAALLARRGAIGAGFDERLHAGEDVDLVWRLTDAGWRVRYEPSASMAHEHRRELGAWARRKLVYGTGAAVLAPSHGRRVAPVVLPGWAAAAWALTLAQRRATVLGGAAVAVAVWPVVARRLGPLPRRYRLAGSLVARGALDSGMQLASALLRAWWPAALLGSIPSRRLRRALALAALADGVADYLGKRPSSGPLHYMLFRRLDDAAYGCGVLAGCWRERTAVPLLPVVRLRSSRAQAASGVQPWRLGREGLGRRCRPRPHADSQ